jgi:hypothetical protein
MNMKRIAAVVILASVMQQATSSAGFCTRRPRATARKGPAAWPADCPLLGVEHAPAT